MSSVTVPLAGSSAVVTYGYGELGRVTSRGVDAATTNLNNVATTFDSLGRVTNVSNALGAFVYAYVNTTSRLSGVTCPTGTGLSTSYAYFNNLGDQRLQTIQNLQGTTNLSKFDYTYNPVGTIATWTQQNDAASSVVNTLAYDNADQLTKSDLTGGTTGHNYYHYDPTGNRLTENTASGTTAGVFNNLNQLKGYTGTTTSTTVAGHTTTPVTSVNVSGLAATLSSSTNFTANVSLPNGTNVVSVIAQDNASHSKTQREQVVVSGATSTPLTYDANGNTLTDENGNIYTWDALNRLTKITYYPSTAYSTFAYDGLSRCTQIAEYDSSHTLTTTRDYLWIGSEMAEERNTTNNAVTKRFFPQGEQQTVSGTTTPYYYTRDHEGSVREMCISTGSSVARYSYDPYGRAPVGQMTTLTSGTNLATFQYTGDYYHATSGLYLTRGGTERPYDSVTGHWLSRDPMEEEGGTNLYTYVNDDPVDKIDPFGFSGCDWVLSIGHGHPIPSSDPIHPNTNNSYYNQNGNACTAYTGCGSNSMNNHGLGGDFPKNGRNNFNEPTTPTPDGSNDYTGADELGPIASTDLNALIAKAKKECAQKPCPCKKITITVLCQTNPGLDQHPISHYVGGYAD